MVRYLVGAHGTGKSTLLEALKSKYPDVFYSEGVTRPVVRALCTLKISSSQVEQELIDELTISAYKNQISNNNILCTRSIIDLIVYNKVFCSDNSKIEKFINLWQETRDRVELLIYTPIEFPLQTDSIRKGVFGDPKIQKQIDVEFQKFFNDYVDEDKITLVRAEGSVEERVEKVEKYFW